jgi:two-component system, NtrC family, nitrogen regulation sensor histidine kinase NtrY
LSDTSRIAEWQIEIKKRRREILWILSLAVFFLALTWLEIRLFSFSQTLPFEHAIFFLGLVNFNIIVFLVLFYFIFRNLVKIFAERPKGIFGGTLKGKLVAAFATFSFVPTALMFLVSVFYINNSFDKWFSEKMAGVLKSSLEVTNAYYVSAKKKNFHFASKVARQLERAPRSPPTRLLDDLRAQYSLDAIEFYPGIFGKRTISLARSEGVPLIPPVSLEFLGRGIKQRVEVSTTHHFEGGDLVRVIVPLVGRGHTGAVVVSSFIPLSLISRMDDIASAYEDFRDANPLEYPVKSIYLVILVLMTLVILLGATWFGFYLAKQLSVPIEALGKATQRVARGDYQRVDLEAGSAELNQLIGNFNAMTGTLEQSEREVRLANENLKATLARLDEHTRYMEVVVSNVTTGVVSIDQSGRVTTINRHAAKLLQIDAKAALGCMARDVLPGEYYRHFEDFIHTMKKHRAQSIGREIRITIGDNQIPLQTTVSMLYDDRGEEVGKVVTFDDLTPVLRAQRAAAWTEVARRIAHEIKNPLTPIKLCAERLKKKFGGQISDPEFTGNIEMIVDQVDSLKGLVNEFGNFARLPQASPSLGSLNQTISDSLRLFIEAHGDCHFELSADENLPDFRFDPDQMKRVITNLLDNAVSAVQETDEKRIEVKTQYDATLKIARLTVTDFGLGIPKPMRERIFEPYVTTKEHGTGLGLAIVKRTVEDHHGFIRALPNQPRGTRIVIELPVIDSVISSSVLRTTDDSLRG